jgi:UDP-glucose 4-epimerase
MNILVTGGAGFIGSHIVEALLERDHHVVCIDNFDPYYDVSLKRANVAPFLEDGNFQLVEGDVRDTDLLRGLLREHSLEVVIHEAAQPGVRASVENPLKAAEVNVAGTLSVLTACVDSGVRKVVNASSSSVYGEVEYLPFDEDHPRRPLSPYGASKLAAEHYCLLFSQLYGLNIVSLRYFTVYGPRMRPDLAIWIFTEKALRNQDIQIYGDGSRTRSFTYIDDVVDATLAAIEKGKGFYNIGEGSRVSVRELAEKIIRLTRSSSKLIFTEAVKGDAVHTQADIRKARRELAWSPKVGLDQGLRVFVDWMRGRRAPV